MAKESDIQSKILKYITSKGGYAVNVIQAGKAGVPDIIACYRGAFLGIEVKLPGNKPSAIQQQNLDMIRTEQGFAIIAYSTKDVKVLLEKVESSEVYREE